MLRAGVDVNLADPDPDARIYKGESGSGRFFLLIILIGRVFKNTKISDLIPTLPPLLLC